jgi:hypothetical protein
MASGCVGRVAHERRLTKTRIISPDFETKIKDPFILSLSKDARKHPPIAVEILKSSGSAHPSTGSG